ncbi:hypothetical protein [Mycobacterium lepromatosis]|uniref:hypothetical protein n=1 Tax=Mycobacterium lepromatosis TaxID=480418 RepID=UPI0006790241|nr:hypothetical protein [Mycobacterium lepromatosis]
MRSLGTPARTVGRFDQDSRPDHHQESESSVLQVDTPISDRDDWEDPRYTLMQIEIASVVVTDTSIQCQVHQR